MLKRINEELGITIILSEHRLDEVIPLATRVVCMDNGRIVYDGSPKTVIAKMWKVENFRPFIPQIPRLFLEWNARDIPFTVREAQMKMNDFSAISYVNEQMVQREKQEVMLSAEHISFQYEKIVRLFYEI